MAGLGEYWVIRVYSAGVASVAFGSGRDEPVHPRPNEVIARLEIAWRLAAEALKATGAAGDAILLST